MERRRGIPLVALVIFIALLVAIILTCTIILRSNKKDKKNNDQAQATVEQPKTSPTPMPVEENETLENEDLINEDADIREAYKLAGNGKTFAKYAIYNSGGFNESSNNIKSDLKLKLAMAQVQNSDMDKSSTAKSVAKSKVQGYAEKIFMTADDIEHKDFSLYSADTNFVEQYKTVGYVYNSEKDTYEIQESEIEESYPPEITEVVTKAVKENGKLEIYVKPLFIKPFYSEEEQQMGCEIYANYNFQSKEFENLFIATYYKEYNDLLKSSYNKDLDKYKYSELAASFDLNQCTEYKYVFVKAADGYKLQSFEQV